DENVQRQCRRTRRSRQVCRWDNLTQSLPSSAKTWDQGNQKNYLRCPSPSSCCQQGEWCPLESATSHSPSRSGLGSLSPQLTQCRLLLRYLGLRLLLLR